jgi:hypothetical protein
LFAIQCKSAWHKYYGPFLNLRHLYGQAINHCKEQSAYFIMSYSPTIISSWQQWPVGKWYLQCSTTKRIQFKWCERKNFGTVFDLTKVESHYSRASSSRLYLESVLSLYELYKNWCVDQKVKFFSVTYSLEFLMK